MELRRLLLAPLEGASIDCSVRFNAFSSPRTDSGPAARTSPDRRRVETPRRMIYDRKARLESRKCYFCVSERQYDAGPALAGAETAAGSSAPALAGAETSRPIVYDRRAGRFPTVPCFYASGFAWTVRGFASLAAASETAARVPGPPRPSPIRTPSEPSLRTAAPWMRCSAQAAGESFQGFKRPAPRPPGSPGRLGLPLRDGTRLHDAGHGGPRGAPGCRRGPRRRRVARGRSPAAADTVPRSRRDRSDRSSVGAGTGRAVRLHLGDCRLLISESLISDSEIADLRVAADLRVGGVADIRLGDRRSPSRPVSP